MWHVYKSIGFSVLYWNVKSITQNDESRIKTVTCDGSWILYNQTGEMYWRPEVVRNVIGDVEWV